MAIKQCIRNTIKNKIYKTNDCFFPCIPRRWNSLPSIFLQSFLLRDNICYILLLLLFILFYHYLLEFPFPDEKAGYEKSASTSAIYMKSRVVITQANFSQYLLYNLFRLNIRRSNQF